MQRAFRPSIWLQLAMFVGVLVILTSGVLIWTAYMFARDMLVAQIHARLTVVTSDRQAMLLAYIYQQHERVRLVGSRTRLRQLLEERVDNKLTDEAFRAGSTRILLDAQKSTEDFLVIAITDLDGKVITATEEMYLGEDFSADAGFVYGRYMAYLGLPYLSRGRYRTILSGPAVASDGRMLGVVVVVLDLSLIEQLLSDATGLGQTGEVLVGKRLGDKVHYLLPPRNNPQTTEILLASVPAMANALQGRKGFMHTTDYRGVEVLAAYQPVEYQGWGMVATIDAAEAYAPVKRLRFVLLALETAILLAGLAASYVLARRFTRPIMALAETAATVAAGDLEARVPVTSSDELGRLATTFNHMTEELEASHATLEQKVAERTRELAQANAELAREIVERKRAEAALIQSEKLASLGQLAAGMAHEINNPIAYVTNNLAVLRRDMRAAMGVLDTYRAGRDSLAGVAPDLTAAAARMEQDIDLAYIQDNFLRDFDASLQGLQRVRDIVGNLRDFARLDEAEFKEADLNAALRSTVEIARHELKKKDIRLETSFEALPPVLCHPGKINQVLLNLLINAVQACQPGGMVALRTRTAPEDTVEVEVEDNGCGISAAHMPHLFEPFFTTKPVGQGMGLGLSVSYGILRDHGGVIEVESTPGRGSLFRVRLPLQPPHQA
jgi:two-component system NtrC family sensor kinase